MTASFRPARTAADHPTITREARRILRRLGEPGAFLALAPDLEKSVVMKAAPSGETLRIASVDRAVAEAFALNDWIACTTRGRVLTYTITPAGRAALRRLLEAQLAEKAASRTEPATPFADQHRDIGLHKMRAPGDGPDEEVRINHAESPLGLLARRRGADGQPFLSADLVAAGERLRVDFEVAQLGPRITQNWERFLTGGERGGFPAGSGSGGGSGSAPEAARARVTAALRELGPGLGDVALRCCCFLEGMEQAEKRMGWAARSGKVVLRIALQRLKRHYAREAEAGRGGLIG